MKTVAVISEFNPFHSGHAHLFDEIRRAFDEPVAVICIMSGNFVQRGEAAIVRKQVRAEAALLGGCDLVLELPFPYSSAAAERFARAGVHIANSLGCVDVLAFGAECADTEKLTRLAECLESTEFRDAYFKADASLGSAEKTEAVYRSLYGDDGRLPLLLQPNTLLGVEYIRALISSKSNIKPLAIQRTGAEHDAPMPTDFAMHPSGKSLREAFENGEEDAFSRLPLHSAELIKNEVSERKSVADNNLLMEYILMHYRLCDDTQIAEADGMAGGLFSRIQHAAREASNGHDFFSRLKTKKYTDAFLRRALLTGVFGITREMLNTLPAYTQVLAMNECGRGILNKVRKTTAIPLLTKPADFTELPQNAKEQAALSVRADSLYCALFRAPLSPADMMRYFPVCKNSENLG